MRSIQLSQTHVHPGSHVLRSFCEQVWDQAQSTIQSTTYKVLNHTHPQRFAAVDLHDSFSALVTMKFWDDTTPVTNKRVADMFQYTVKEVRIMEQRFLKGLDYHLSLLPEDIHKFMTSSIRLLTPPTATTPQLHFHKENSALLTYV